MNQDGSLFFAIESFFSVSVESQELNLCLSGKVCEATLGSGREESGAWSFYTDCSSSGGSNWSPILTRTAWRFTGHLTGRSPSLPPLTGSKLQGALGRSVR